jgi:hypothetical protein
LLGGCQASSVRKGKRTYKFALCFEYGKDFALNSRGPRAGFEVCDGFIDDVTKSFWKLFERDIGAFEAAKKAQQVIRGTEEDLPVNIDYENGFGHRVDGKST